MEEEEEGRLGAGLPREVRMCAGPVLGSMVDCGISRDMTDIEMSRRMRQMPGTSGTSVQQE